MDANILVEKDERQAIEQLRSTTDEAPDAVTPDEDPADEHELIAAEVADFIDK